MSTQPLRVVPAQQSQASKPAVRFARLDEVEPEPTSWLFPGRIHLGAVTIIEGDPSAGKSTLLSELSAVITTGRPWLDRPEQPPRGVLWLTSEEDAGSTIRQRLDAAHASIGRVRVVAHDEIGDVPRITFPGSVRMLGEACEAFDIALLIVDPLVSYMGDDLDTNNEQCVRRALDPLAAMCRERNVTAALVRQLKKDRSGPRITHGLGGMAVSAVARSVHQLDRPDAGSTRRVLRSIKVSPGPAAQSLEYHLDVSDGAPIMRGLRTLGPTEDDAAGDLVDAGERHVREDARRLLSLLLDKEWVRANVIIRMASESGIGERTLWKAKAELRCASRRVGGGSDSYSEWGPPGSADTPLSPPVQSTARGLFPAKKPRKPRKKRGE